MDSELGRSYQSEFAQNDLPFDEQSEQIWTRRAKEPGRAWSAFVVYCDMPPSQRNIAAAPRNPVQQIPPKTLKLIPPFRR